MSSEFEFSTTSEQHHLEITLNVIDDHHLNLENDLISADVAGQRKVYEARDKIYQEVRPKPFFSVILDLSNEHSSEQPIRIGKHAIHGSRAKLLVASWTTDEGKKYAQQERQLNNEIYGALVEIQDGKVTAVIDTIASKAEKRRERILIPKSADLKDIIDLVSPEQDDVVRLEHPGGLVISGGPGTGKTVVGLQRIAYKLMQGEESILQNGKVLVIGPSESYLNYIRDFFPRLGLRQVENRNLDRLCNELIPNSAKRELIDLRTETDLIRRTKNSKDFCRVVQEGIWPQENKVVLNAFVETGLDKRENRILEDSDISELVQQAKTKFMSGEISYKQARINIGVEIQKLLINPKTENLKNQTKTHDGQRADLFDRWLLRIGAYNQEARQGLKALYESPQAGRHKRAMSSLLNEYYKEDIENAIDANGDVRAFDFGELRNWLNENQAQKKNGGAIDAAKTEFQESEIVSVSISFNQITSLKPNETLTEVMEVVDKLLPQQELLNVARRICTGSDGELFMRVLGSVTGASLSSRLSESASKIKKRGKYFWSDVDVVVIAELSNRLDGGSDSNRYRHVMIDEAQDLTRLELRVISNFAKNAEISLVGDLNQATKIGYLGSWQEIAFELGITDLRIVNLQHNYRIPENIYDYARMYLDENERVETPTCDLEGGEIQIQVIPSRKFEHILEQLINAKSAEKERVAVICGDIKFNREGNQNSSENVVYLSPEEVKGLEVDHAIVLKPSAWFKPTGRMRNLMYVSLTRATKSLTILEPNVGTAGLVKLVDGP